MSNSMFSWRKAILKSALPSTTRHVLLTLACHMNEAGESCFPSIKLLCEETGLSNRAVITHLQNATELGWVTVGKHGFAGQRWASHEYRPAWPHHLREVAESLEKAVNNVHNVKKKAVKEVHDLSNKAVNVIPKAVNVIPEGSEPSDRKAVKEVHTSTSVSTSMSKPESTSILLPDESGAISPSTETELQSACRATWKSYSDAYFHRYGVEPIRNAAVNTSIKGFVQKLPYNEAPHVAAFFVSHNDKFYVQKTHSVFLLLKDAEGLRTQWATGRSMTTSRATQLDRSASNLDSVNQAIEMMKARKHASV